MPPHPLPFPSPIAAGGPSIAKPLSFVRSFYAYIFRFLGFFRSHFPALLPTPGRLLAAWLHYAAHLDSRHAAIGTRRQYCRL